jgi:hypothetical protein
MVYRQRSRRVALLGARVQLAITIADVVNVSRTGVRIGASHEWRAGSEWPLVLELPAAAPMRVIGRVARCEPADVSLPKGGVVQNRYQLAFTFVDLSTEAAAVLDLVCSTAAETGERTG